MASDGERGGPKGPGRRGPGNGGPGGRGPGGRGPGGSGPGDRKRPTGAGGRPPPRGDGPRGPERGKGKGDDRGQRRTDRRPPVPRPEPEPEGERIAKRLARAGIASRRDVERMIEDGRVTLNGKKLDTPATLVTFEDKIEVDGRLVPPPERTRLWLYHKPAGLVTTAHDPEGRATVFESLPEDVPRVVSVGRLDINTEGLLLLTNDGGLARVLELPATGWLRRYRVRAHGRVRQTELDELKHGMAVEGTFYGAIEATLEREQGSNMWLTLGLREGKNREVKNVLGALGLDVNRLIRISYGPFQLGELAPGSVREIKGKGLREQLGERLIEQAGANFDADVRPPPRPAPREAEDTERPRTVKKHGDWVSGANSPFHQPKESRADKEARFAREEKGERGALRGRAPVRRVFDEDGKPYRVREEPPKFEKREKRNDERHTRHVWRAEGGRPAADPEAAERERIERDRKREARDAKRGGPGGRGRPASPRNGRPARDDRSPRDDRKPQDDWGTRPDKGPRDGAEKREDGNPRREGRRFDGPSGAARPSDGPRRERGEGGPGERPARAPGAGKRADGPRFAKPGRDGPRSGPPKGDGPRKPGPRGGKSGERGARPGERGARPSRDGAGRSSGPRSPRPTRD